MSSIIFKFYTNCYLFRKNEHKVVFADHIQLIQGLTLNKGWIFGLADLGIQNTGLLARLKNLGFNGRHITMKPPNPPDSAIKEQRHYKYTYTDTEHLKGSVQKAAKPKAYVVHLIHISISSERRELSKLLSKPLDRG